MYPVRDGRLRRHPRLCDPSVLSGCLLVYEREVVAYCSGSLKPRMVTPSGNVVAAFKKAERSVRNRFVSTGCSFRSQVRQLTLLVLISVGVVETPDLRHESAQVLIVGVVLPGSPVGGPRQLAAQCAHASISIRVHDPPSGHDATCTFGGAMPVDVTMRLSRDGGEQGG